jgi:hypothetical protein
LIRGELWIIWRPASCLHDATKSEPLKFQNTDKPLTRMKITDLPTNASMHKGRISTSTRTKRPRTFQHRAGIWNGNIHYVDQHPVLSSRNLRKICHSQTRTTKEMLTKPKISDADHQPAKQRSLIRGHQKARRQHGSYLRRPPTPPAVFVQLTPVNLSRKADSLRFTNQLY